MIVNISENYSRMIVAYGKYNLVLVAQELGCKSGVRSTPLEYPDLRATSKRLYDCRAAKSNQFY